MPWQGQGHGKARDSHFLCSCSYSDRSKLQEQNGSVKTALQEENALKSLPCGIHFELHT